ncbi:MAG: hypothetical protein PVF79_09200, partial [Desulfobacterales bacterium]
KKPIKINRFFNSTSIRTKKIYIIIILRYSSRNKLLLRRYKDRIEKRLEVTSGRLATESGQKNEIPVRSAAREVLFSARTSCVSLIKIFRDSYEFEFAGLH